MAYYILADCNNFYVSCERLFNPALENRAVIVLSNNDGCVVARSEEAKKIGIQMGIPFFIIEQLCEMNHVAIFSSNYALYGDISQRVMNILSDLGTNVEIYSIDEAFLYYPSETCVENLVIECAEIKRKVKKWLGIPLSLGIAPTKTLAKIANDFAKKNPSYGIFELSCKNSTEILKNYSVSDIWGIGKGFAQRLATLGIYTAWDFRIQDPALIRKKMGVVGERIVWELRGVSCLPMSLLQAKKSINSSRSFGKIVESREELAEALATFVNKASIKLRAQRSFACGLYIYLEAGLNNETGLRQKLCRTHALSFPTNNTCELITLAKNMLNSLYIPTYKYKKCGISLLDLIPEKNIIPDLFLGHLDANKQALMRTIDSINSSFGKNTVFFGAMGIKQKWQMRKERCSTHNTTSWKHLPIVKC